MQLITNEYLIKKESKFVHYLCCRALSEFLLWPCVALGHKNLASTTSLNVRQSNKIVQFYSTKNEVV